MNFLSSFSVVQIQPKKRRESHHENKKMMRFKMYPNTSKNRINTGFLARLEGLEPPTYWFVASHSIQLSYKRIFSF